MGSGMGEVGGSRRAGGGAPEAAAMRESAGIAPTLRPQSAQSASRQQQGSGGGARGMRPGSARERRIVGRVHVASAASPAAGLRSAGTRPVADTRAMSVGKRLGAEQTDSVPRWQVSADMPETLGGMRSGALGGDRAVFEDKGADHPARYKMSKDYPRFMASVAYPDPRSSDPKPVRERNTRPASEDAPHYMGGLAEGVNANRADGPRGFGVDRVITGISGAEIAGKNRSYSCSHLAPEWMNKLAHDDVIDEEQLRTADPETAHKHAGGARQTGSDANLLKDAPADASAAKHFMVGKARVKAGSGLAVKGVASSILSEVRAQEEAGDAFTAPGGVHHGGRKRFHVRAKRSDAPSYAKQTIASLRRGPQQVETDQALLSLADKMLQAKSKREFFNSFAVAGGHISREAFEEGLRRHGVWLRHNARDSFDKGIATRLFARLDPRGEGSISFEEFNAQVQPAEDRRHPDSSRAWVQPSSAAVVGNDAGTAPMHVRPGSPPVDKNFRGISGAARLRKELQQKLYNRTKKTWNAYSHFNTHWDNGLDVGEFAQGLQALNIPVESEQDVKDLFDEIADERDEHGTAHTVTFSRFRKHFYVNDGESGEALFGPDRFLVQEGELQGKVDVAKANAVLDRYAEECGRWGEPTSRGAWAHPLNVSVREGKHEMFLELLRDRIEHKFGSGQSVKKFGLFQKNNLVAGGGGSRGVITREDFKSGVRSLDLPLPPEEVITSILQSCHGMPSSQSTREHPGTLPSVELNYRQFIRLLNRPDRPLVDGIEHTTLENLEANVDKGEHTIRTLQPRLVYSSGFSSGMSGIDMKHRKLMSTSRIMTRARSARA